MSIAVDTRNIFTIAQLNQRARDLLEGEFPAIWVEGEISNLVAPSSGHLYFTLKDSQAQVRAAMFRGNNRYLTYSPRNGLKVLVRCRVSLYPARGDYQLIVELMEESGEGALRRAFELLKQKLAGEGLFDASLKQLLPSYPEHVGVVTSPTGAAIKDILSVFKRRFPAIEISILPVMVQGEGSATAIARAIKKANQLKFFDVLIVGRGGGSLEDLWGFNEEIVARAIFASKIPVISAVGHEIDFTISDLVADVRAPTPSAAAELLSPNQGDIQARLRNTEQVLFNAVKRNIALRQQNLKQVKKRLKHPGQTLQEQTQRLDRLEVRLKKAALSAVSQQNIRLAYTENRLSQNSPQTRIAHQQQHLLLLEKRLRRSFTQLSAQRYQALHHLSHRLNTLSPLATLARGYSITACSNNHNKKSRIIRHINEVKIGDTLISQLNKGIIYSIVSDTHDKKDPILDKD